MRFLSVEISSSAFDWGFYGKSPGAHHIPDQDRTVKVEFVCREMKTSVLYRS